MKQPPKVSERRNSSEPPRAIRRQFYTSEDFEGALNEAMTTGQAVELSISSIRESPYQHRGINQEHLAELKANIAAHGLITAVVVRQLTHGTFELIAGHHRVKAFVELGHDKIPAMIVKLDDKLASAAVFYDNLHGPDLTDFEKFVGLRQRMEASNFTISELAIESGISPRQVKRLLSYSILPDVSLALLAENPTKISGNAAEVLAELAATGKADLVQTAIEKVIKGEIEQSKVGEWINANIQLTNKSLPKIEKVKPVSIYSSGKKIFCRIQPAPKTLRFSFENDNDALELKTILEEAVRGYLKTKHGG